MFPPEVVEQGVGEDVSSLFCWIVVGCLGK